MPEDPAQTFAERRARVEKLIDQAQAQESESVHDQTERGIWRLVFANNLRLKAICEDFGLRGSVDKEGDDSGE
jgi:hypothetical protein